MLLKLSEIVPAMEALGRISKQSFPGLISYQIQKNIKALQPEFQTYEDTRVEMVKKKYGKKGEGDNYRVPPERFKAFSTELKKILAQEVNIEIIKISLVEFPKEITPADLMALEWMFDLSGVTGEKPGKPARKRH